MNNDDMDFINNIGDKLAFEMLNTIFHRILPEDNIVIPTLNLAYKHGMPVKNILPFIQDLCEWAKEHNDNSRKEVSDLLSRSGFLTVGFNPDQKEGDVPNGNG